MSTAGLTVRVIQGPAVAGAVIELRFHVIERVVGDFIRSSDAGRLEFLVGFLTAIALGWALRTAV